jgi:hypothetical protein
LHEHLGCLELALIDDATETHPPMCIACPWVCAALTVGLRGDERLVRSFHLRLGWLDYLAALVTLDICFSFPASLSHKISLLSVSDDDDAPHGYAAMNVLRLSGAALSNFSLHFDFWYSLILGILRFSFCEPHFRLEGMLFDGSSSM